MIGIDFSEEMLAQASVKLAPGVRLVQADCLASPLTDRSSDWILASFLLSYLEDLRGFACEVARIARTGGSILISDVHPDNKKLRMAENFSLH